MIVPTISNCVDLYNMYMSMDREDLAKPYAALMLKTLDVPTVDDVLEQIDKKKIYEDFEKLYQKFSNHKQTKENKMEVRVKKDFLYLHDFSAILKKFTLGIYEGEKLSPDNLIAINGILLTPDVIRLNSDIFEIIEDWKPDPFHNDFNRCYNSSKHYNNDIGNRQWVDYLSKQERAIRKMRQIADHLNSLQWTDGTKYCIKHLSMLEGWRYEIMSKDYHPGEIYFYNMSNGRLMQIISLMDNGDGIGMNDLL